jgi:hypothetical protein
MVPLMAFSHFVFVPVKKHSGVGCSLERETTIEGISVFLAMCIFLSFCQFL